MSDWPKCEKHRRDMSRVDPYHPEKGYVCRSCEYEEESRQANEDWLKNEKPWIDRANEEFDDVLIPPCPQVDVVEGGAYVQAWVFVAAPEESLDTTPTSYRGAYAQQTKEREP